MATKVSKRIKQAYTKIEETKAYPLKDALELLQGAPKVKFDETIELHFSLSIDTKASDQNIRGTVALPHGTGKSLKVAVICQGENVNKATAAGADFVGAADLILKIEQGFLGFDCLIATPDMMKDLSKLGKVLGPRGLMPSPKAGTVTADVERALREVKAGRVEFKNDKQGGIHLGVGKRSFPADKLYENATHVIDAVSHSKPSSVKGVFIKSLYVSSTMGAGIKVQI
ncbi:MAG: 50S ribosomal protein L1 [Candidatus Omnitrophica bacterium]|nr:50S ribosomal protein L1 [Candidatus Omnitrophota bacterium]